MILTALQSRPQAANLIGRSSQGSIQGSNTIYLPCQSTYIRESMLTCPGNFGLVIVYHIFKFETS